MFTVILFFPNPLNKFGIIPDGTKPPPPDFFFWIPSSPDRLQPVPKIYLCEWNHHRNNVLVTMLQVWIQRPFINNDFNRLHSDLPDFIVPVPNAEELFSILVL